MSVWLTIPSARPVNEVLPVVNAWRERGYRIALWCDFKGEATEDVSELCDRSVCQLEYPGYAQAVNTLIRCILREDPNAEWFVIGGDDVHPDPNHSAEEIAQQCREHFATMHAGPEAEAEQPVDLDWMLNEQYTRALFRGIRNATFGVMQPTGDRWGENPNHPRPDMRSAYIDRVAGSAWLGREFCRRVNQGNGPLWPEYQHMFVDEELRHVAVKLGIYWERRDLTHHHAHAGRVPNYTPELIPEHLKKWTLGEQGRKHWRESEAIFFRRRDAGFPGSEVL